MVQGDVSFHYGTMGYHHRPRILRKIVLLAVQWCCLALCASAVQAQGLVMRAAAIPEGWPPFVVPASDNGSQTGGIMFDVLRTIAERTDVVLHVNEYPEPRAVLLLESAGLDVFPKCREWMVSPERFLWSAPVLTVGEAVLTRQGEPCSTAAELKLCPHVAVGTVNGFRHPEFESLFASGSLTRANSADVKAALRMLQHGRVQAVLTNPHVAYWYTTRCSEFRGQFTISSPYVTGLEYRFAFARNAGWERYLPRFDAALRQMQESGELETIIRKYLEDCPLSLNGLIPAAVPRVQRSPLS